MQITQDLCFDGKNFSFQGKIVTEAELQKIRITHFSGDEYSTMFHYKENLLKEISKLVNDGELKYLSYSSKYPALVKRGTKVRKIQIEFKGGEKIFVFSLRDEEDYDSEYLSFYPNINIGKKLGSNLNCSTNCTWCDEEKKCPYSLFVKEGMDPFGFILIPKKNTTKISA